MQVTSSGIQTPSSAMELEASCGSFYGG